MSDYEYEPDAPPGEDRTGLALGFLAMVPMFCVYEWALIETGGTRRNAAELALGLAFERLLGSYAVAARVVTLLVCTLLAFALLRRRSVPVREGLARIVFEGVVGAVALGPILATAFDLLGDLAPPLELRWEIPARRPNLARAGLLLGGGAYEELLFRVGLYSLVYLLFAKLLRAPGGGFGARRLVAEALALVLSSVAFSLFHLRTVTKFLGAGGEEFDPGVFTWRAVAGILLAVLFRWRGPGVAAWTHGVFNVALLLGIGPETSP